MSDRPVVVVGLMGSGKTTVAQRVAEALARPFRDSDSDLTQRYGGTAAEQFAQHGQRELHAREAAVLRDALAARPAPVVAAAASVVDDPGCRQTLAGAYVVWLDASPRVLADRIDPGDHRPYYDPDPAAMLVRQYAQRADRFRSVADLRVDVSEHGPEQTVAAVLAALTARSAAGADRPGPDEGSRDRQ